MVDMNGRKEILSLGTLVKRSQRREPSLLERHDRVFSNCTSCVCDILGVCSRNIVNFLVIWSGRETREVGL